MKEVRCIKCNKLLGKIEGKYEIVCSKCKKLNKSKKKSTSESR